MLLQIKRSCYNNKVKKKHINWEVASKYNTNFKTSKFLSRRKHDKSMTFHKSVTLKFFANSRHQNNMDLIVGYK